MSRHGLFVGCFNENTIVVHYAHSVVIRSVCGLGELGQTVLHTNLGTIQQLKELALRGIDGRADLGQRVNQCELTNIQDPHTTVASQR